MPIPPYSLIIEKLYGNHFFKQLPVLVQGEFYNLVPSPLADLLTSLPCYFLPYDTEHKASHQTFHYFDLSRNFFRRFCNLCLFILVFLFLRVELSQIPRFSNGDATSEPGAATNVSDAAATPPLCA